MVWIKRDIIALVFYLFLLATILLLPFTDEFTFDKQEGIFQWVRETIASRLRIVNPKQKLFLLEDLKVPFPSIQLPCQWSHQLLRNTSPVFVPSYQM